MAELQLSFTQSNRELLAKRLTSAFNSFLAVYQMDRENNLTSWKLLADLEKSIIEGGFSIYYERIKTDSKKELGFLRRAIIRDDKEQKLPIYLISSFNEYENYESRIVAERGNDFLKGKKIRNSNGQEATVVSYALNTTRDAARFSVVFDSGRTSAWNASNCTVVI